LIHNNKWNSKYALQQRPNPQATRPALGWKPYIVVSGFEDPSLAETLATRLAGPREVVMALAKDKATDLLSHRRTELLKIVTDETTGFSTRNLKVHWNDIKDMELASRELATAWPTHMQHNDGIDVSQITAETYDEEDMDDPRNFRRILQEKKVNRMEQRVRKMAKELNIDREEVMQVLASSKESAWARNKGKMGRKERAVIIGRPKANDARLVIAAEMEALGIQ
jgi:hypothetical protein